MCVCVCVRARARVCVCVCVHKLRFRVWGLGFEAVPATRVTRRQTYLRPTPSPTQALHHETIGRCHRPKIGRGTGVDGRVLCGSQTGRHAVNDGKRIISLLEFSRAMDTEDNWEARKDYEKRIRYMHRRWPSSIIFPTREDGRCNKTTSRSESGAL